jgi:hypothetical protein
LVHVPLLVVNELPTAGVPLMAGSAVLAGAPMTALGLLVAVAVPSGCVAVTATRNVEPTSSGTSV